MCHVPSQEINPAFDRLEGTGPGLQGRLTDASGVTWVSFFSWEAFGAVLTFGIIETTSRGASTPRPSHFM